MIIDGIKELCKTTRNVFEKDKRLSDLPPERQNEWKEFVEPKNYRKFESNLGNLVFESVLNGANESDGTFMGALKEKFKRLDDKRCQVGQVFSHIEKNNYENAHLFRKNVRSVVLILDKKDLKITDSGKPGYIEIESVVCSKAIEFPAPDNSGTRLKLCEQFYYSEERIPARRILGSGVFIAPDKIATAAHVVYEAFEAGVDPKDMIFVGAHFVYEVLDHIWVDKNMIYQLDQNVIKKNNQMINGAKGDSAWLRVKPLFPSVQNRNPAPGPRSLDIKIPDVIHMQAKQPVYSLGHGFGVPMKLSFGGSVEYLGNNGWLGCDLDIFPGNSGSPVFHADTHELLGIISGPDNLWRQVVETQNCIDVKINNDRGQSVETSQIELLIQKIQNQ